MEINEYNVKVWIKNDLELNLDIPAFDRYHLLNMLIETGVFGYWIKYATRLKITLKKRNLTDTEYRSFFGG